MWTKIDARLWTNGATGWAAAKHFKDEDGWFLTNTIGGTIEGFKSAEEAMAYEFVSTEQKDGV